MDEIAGFIGYTPRQVADLLGYKVSSVYALLSRREMQASRVGRNRVISQNQLNDFLNRRSSSEVIIDYTK